MPVYEYSCSACGSKFEVLVRSFSSRDEARCASCGSRKVEKLFSVFGVGGGSRSESGDGDGGGSGSSCSGCARASCAGCRA